MPQATSGLAVDEHGCIVADPETGATRIAGDVDPGVAEIASWISPNPGGVGPMTRAMLLNNVVESAERALDA